MRGANVRSELLLLFALNFAVYNVSPYMYVCVYVCGELSAGTIDIGGCEP